MPDILVVDDSAVDRTLVGGLLSSRPGYRVTYANDGEEGLIKVRDTSPDIVLTDLVMPNMNGLELVSAIEEGFAGIPTILMTSQGNEEIAVKALQAGAASYVPKRALGDELLTTIESVLEINAQKIRRAKLLRQIEKNEITFQLENDRNLVGPVINYVLDHATAMGQCNQSDRVRLGLAIEEALLNSIYHGNLEVGSELKEQDDALYHSTIEERRHITPYCDRRVRVHVRMSKTELKITISDEGRGFDPNSLPDPADPVNLERVCGRGVLLMRTFMDDVQYNSVGNEVTMVKRRRTPELVAAAKDGDE